MHKRKTSWLFIGWLTIATAAAAAPRYQPEIVESFPHDPGAFTQGLVYADGVFYESVGRYGESALRRVDPATGEVLAERQLDDRYFGEGLALVGERLVQLTWKAGRGFVHDRETLERIGEFRYEGEGWGLAYDGERLILSDGSDVLRFLDPDDFHETGRLTVRHQGRPVPRLNELEYIGGEIWANLWPSDRIARIDPESGEVTGIIDAGVLRDEIPAIYRMDVLNGIAHDPETGRIFLTGKWWPRLFEVRLKENP
jgi:glutamine cyclotransferase